VLKKEGDLSPFFYFLTHTVIMGKMIFLYCLSLTFAIAAYFMSNILLLFVVYSVGWIWSYYLVIKYSKLISAISRAKKRKN